MIAPPVEERLIELEVRLAFQERMIEDLSEVVAEQAKSLEKLTAILSRQGDRLLSLEQGGGASPQDERPPPHY